MIRHVLFELRLKPNEPSEGKYYLTLLGESTILGESTPTLMRSETYILGIVPIVRRPYSARRHEGMAHLTRINIS